MTHPARTIFIALVVTACGSPTASVTVPSASASATPVVESPLAAPPERANHGSGAKGCFTREELAARLEQAKADDEATYLEALRRSGLEPIRLTAHVLVHGMGELQGPRSPTHVEERELPDHRRARLVVMAPISGCGVIATAFDFARAGRRVWLVHRRVQTRKIDVVTCGCPACKCEPVDYTGSCGGARIVADTIVGYELPAGTELAGEREIQYVQDWVTVAEAMPPQPVCAPTQPLP